MAQKTDSQSLSSLIWNVADDVLRGLFKQHEYGDVILPFVVLRRWLRPPGRRRADDELERG